MRARGLAGTRAGSAVALAAAALLSGCSVTNAFQDLTRIDYKSATKGPPLDIPPDLVTPRTDERFAVPERPSQGTTFSAFSRDRAEPKAATPGAPAVLAQPAGARIERQGAQRWLVIDQPPDKVWPVLRDFWGDAGFVLRLESPETGIMETDWAEKRPQVADGWVRQQLSRVLNSFYSTGERDKFRTRLETDGKVTEVFVSHRGLAEEFTGAAKDATVWVPRPSDPELEVEFLRRMMLRFAPERQASLAPAATAGGTAPGAAPAAAAPPERARVVEADGRSFVTIDDGFDRAWRQVGLALDRSGFTVEDRDRSRGTYFVRYVDPEQESKAAGVFDRVFGTGSRKDLTGKRYRIVVEGSASAGSRVGVLDEGGAPPASDADRRIATRIVSLLRDQLR